MRYVRKVSPVWVFLILVILLSWPCLLYGFGWFSTEENLLKRYIFSCSGMLMVAFSAFLTRAFIERKGFNDVGWKPGHYKLYLAILCLCLLMWVSPALIALLFGKLELNQALGKNEISVIALSLGGFSLIAGFGEEFGWRGYLLPRLLSGAKMTHYALVLVGFVWGVWHCAVAIGPFVKAVIESTSDWLPLIGPLLFRCLQMIASSIALSFIFGAVWLNSKSIFLSSFFHGYWIGIRDSISHLFIYPSEYQWITVIFVLAAWIISYSWLQNHEISVDAKGK